MSEPGRLQLNEEGRGDLLDPLQLLPFERIRERAIACGRETAMFYTYDWPENRDIGTGTGAGTERKGQLLVASPRKTENFTQAIYTILH